jgi:hypothetical protein
MAVLGEAFAALLAEIEERTGASDGAASFIALPSTPRTISPGGLVFDPQQLASDETSDGDAANQAIRNQALFALMVDDVSDGGPQLSATAEPMSKIYEDALTHAIMPAEGDAALKVAKRFGERRAALSTALRTAVDLGGARFFETGFEPLVDIEDTASWTPVALDASAITERSATLSPPMRERLAQSGMLADVAAVALTSARVEICVLTVIRPWFDRSLFEAVDWDLGGEPLSDGADPPKGRLPAYIEGLVLARDFRIQLDVAVPQTSEETGAVKALARVLMVRRDIADTAGSATEAVSMTGVIARVGPGDPAVVTPVETATSQIPLPVLVDGRAVADQKRVEADEGARALGEIETELAACLAKLSALTATADGLRQRLARYPPDAMTVQVRDHRDLPLGLNIERTLDLGPMRSELASAEVQIAAAETERSELERRAGQQRDVVNDLEEIVASYEALARPDERPVVSVLAFLCRRPPKSPAPDLTLFPPKP